MAKILIKESDLIKLIETAMDLDIYSQPTAVDTDNGNLDTEDTIEDIISKLKELLYMIKQGKAVDWEVENEINKESDKVNQIYDRLKYDK
jgi:hypothetical protein